MAERAFVRAWCSGYIGWKIKAPGPRSPYVKMRRARLSKAAMRLFKRSFADSRRRAQAREAQR